MIRMCKFCESPMKLTMSFSKEGNKQYFKCTKCFGETKKKRLHIEDFVKEE